jgi:creatinine amidohydrolase
MTRLLMEEMTSGEIAEAVAAGHTTAILPMGSVEAHGHHLPINTDTLVARRIAEMVAARLGDALVAHALPFGYAPRTIFHGTISVPVSVVLELLASYCAALERDGFRTIVLLPMHGESFQTVGLFAPEVATRFPNLTIVPSVNVEALLTLRNTILRDYGVTADEAGWHAGAAETAEVLAISPDLVRHDRVRRGYLGPSGFGRIAPETLRGGWGVFDREGVMGDPTRATSQMGVALLDAIAEDLAQAVRRIPRAEPVIGDQLAKGVAR